MEVLCHIGYVIDNRMLPNDITSKKITCQQDGTWDSDFPSCTGKPDEDDDYWSCDLIMWYHPIISAISSGQSCHMYRPIAKKSIECFRIFYMIFADITVECVVFYTISYYAL